MGAVRTTRRGDRRTADRQCRRNEGAKKGRRAIRTGTSLTCAAARRLLLLRHDAKALTPRIDNYAGWSAVSPTMAVALTITM